MVVLQIQLVIHICLRITTIRCTWGETWPEDHVHVTNHFPEEQALRRNVSTFNTSRNISVENIRVFWTSWQWVFPFIFMFCMRTLAKRCTRLPCGMQFSTWLSNKTHINIICAILNCFLQIRYKFNTESNASSLESKIELGGAAVQQWKWCLIVCYIYQARDCETLDTLFSSKSALIFDIKAPGVIIPGFPHKRV